MAHPIQIPRLGWSMEEGVFVEWLRADGDTIEPGDVLFTGTGGTNAVLHDGDVVEIEIPGIGTLSNPVAVE